MLMIPTLLWAVAMVQASTLVEEAIAPFPKVLWTYWDSGEAGMRLFTRLCVCNMAYYAKLSGWEFHLVTEATLSQYISK